jgi:hypothetical protein
MDIGCFFPWGGAEVGEHTIAIGIFLGVSISRVPYFFLKTCSFITPKKVLAGKNKVISKSF